MTNLSQRVLLFVVAIPALFLVSVVLPDPRFLILKALAIVVAGIGSVEVARLISHGLRKRVPGVGTPTVSQSSVVAHIATGICLPAAAVVQSLAFAHLPSGDFVAAAAVGGCMVILGIQVFYNHDNQFDAIIATVASHVVVLVYPGLFIAYFVRMTALPAAGPLIVVFFAAVYFNDTAAFLAGKMFGRSSIRLSQISPNKTLIGFVAGFLTSVATVGVGRMIIPELFPGALWRVGVLGVAIGFSAIIGDLAESALKRSAQLKDSGEVMPGRGGVMDSVDSPVFSAPVFFLVYSWLFL